MTAEHFVIIGAQRSGTSYLYEVLDEHPEIRMAKPRFPEPKFFLDPDLFDRGREYYEQRHFSKAGTAHIYGEKSTSYYEFEACARRISRYFPAMKIIMVLRNPVIRALSNYFFSVRHGLEERTLREVFIDKVKPQATMRSISTDPYNYLGRGEYIRFLTLYEQYFPRAQILTPLFEDLVGNEEAVRKVYTWLGATGNFVPGGLYSQVNALPTRYDLIEEAVIAAIARHFIPYNRQLEQWLGSSLEQWKNA